jgi:hypothetical protein
MVLANVALVTFAVGCAVLAVYCKRSLVRESRGLEIHAHPDGTVHEHHRGAVAHVHPTFAERYESRVARVLGGERG